MLETIYKTLTKAGRKAVLNETTLVVGSQIISVIDINGEPNLLVQHDGSDLVNHYLIQNGKFGTKKSDPSNISDMECMFVEPNYGRN
jgi:hypothetical protein